MTLEQQIHEWVMRERATILDCLRYLVSIDTQNLAPHGRERPGQMAVAGMLRAMGCAVDVYEIASVPGLLEHPRYWSERPCIGRPNVMGIRRGSGAGRSLMFSSHMDTVPVGHEAWLHDAWGGDVADGKLFGLGAYDMKGGLAASLMVAKALNDLGVKLRGDLYIESVVDEEFGGCNGTLAARLKYNADLAIVPEPTNLAVCPAHHGGLMLRVTFMGKPGWSFSPEHPVDPIIALARFVQLLNAWATDRTLRISVPAIYSNNPKLPVLINQLKAGDVTLPYFADRVPGEAWLTLWAETYLGATESETLGDLQAFYANAQLHDPVLAAFEPIWKPVRWLDGSAIPADHQGVLMLADTVQQVRRQPAAIEGALFACDGHMFNLYSSTPMVLLGPTGGQPHSPDEFVYLDDYLSLVEIFIRATIKWCEAAS